MQSVAFYSNIPVSFQPPTPHSTVPREAAPPIRMQEAEVDGFSKEVRAASPQRCCRGPVVWGTRSRNAFPTRELHSSRGGVVSPEAFQVHVFPEFSWKATRGMVTDDRCCLSQPVPPSLPPPPGGRMGPRRGDSGSKAGRACRAAVGIRRVSIL